MGMFSELRKQETTPTSQETRRKRGRSSTALTEQAQATEPAQPDRTTRTTVRPVRRPKIRYAFEFYQDQVERLRHLSMEDRMQGGLGSMSEMVREAVDFYIAKRERARK